MKASGKYCPTKGDFFFFFDINGFSFGCQARTLASEFLKKVAILIYLLSISCAIMLIFINIYC